MKEKQRSKNGIRNGVAKAQQGRMKVCSAVKKASVLHLGDTCFLL